MTHTQKMEFAVFIFLLLLSTGHPVNERMTADSSHVLGVCAHRNMLSHFLTFQFCCANTRDFCDKLWLFVFANKTRAEKMCVWEDALMCQSHTLCEDLQERAEEMSGADARKRTKSKKEKGQAVQRS